MSDIITLTTLLTAAGGGVLVPFVNKLLGPGAEELGTMIAERGRIYRLQNTFNVFQKAKAMAAEAGFDPQQVNLKTLLPLLEGASLEDNPSLSDKWAALLANAADPADSISIKPVYADILRQLTPHEAQVLDKIFIDADAMNPLADGYKVREDEYANNEVRKARAVSQLIDLAYMRYTHHEHSGRHQQDRGALQEFDSITDILLRHRLLVMAKSKPPKGSSFGFDYEPEKGKAFLSSLGFDFMLACTPPEKQNSL